MSTFLEAIADHGYAAPREIIMDGNIHRFATDANKRHSKDGWYIGFDDATGKAGVFGSWRDGASITWSNGTGRKLTERELEEVKQKQQEAKNKALKDQYEASQRAKRVFDHASTVGVSTYLTKKGIEAPEGVRFVAGISSSVFGFNFEPRNMDAILVPMYGPKGTMQSMQIIEDNGTKLFMKNGKTSGGWFSIGDWKEAKQIVIAEGLATAQSIRQATNYPVLAAFSAHNLLAVAQMVRSQNALAEIMIAVDGDKAGREYSAKAAEVCSGKLIEAPDGMDWNDVHQQDGIELVIDAFIAEYDENWKAELIVKNKSDGTQTIKALVHNIMVYLRNAPEFKGRIRFNELTQQITIDDEDIDEIKATVIKASLESNYFYDKVGTKDVEEALGVVARERSYHPIRNYLKSLKWDGKERVRNLLPHYFGSENSEYNRSVSQSLMVSAVARAMNPGCQVDTMVILEGGQGSYKSSSISTLFSSEWHSEVSASITDKDFYQNMRGKWVMEFGEMTHITRADSNHIKQVLTIRIDNYRASYGRFSKSYPRQNIFIGTTNDDAYLKDATGARRYLPVKTNTIKLADIKADRDQLWAEAMHLHQHGASWWEIPGAEEEQEKRYEGDSWEGIIAGWLEDIHKEPSASVETQTTTAEIMLCALGIEKAKQTRADQTRVGAIMKRLKWNKRRVTVGETKLWVYVKMRNKRPT